jgi:hypothetical protein
MTLIFTKVSVYIIISYMKNNGVPFSAALTEARFAGRQINLVGFSLSVSQLTHQIIGTKLLLVYCWSTRKRFKKGMKSTEACQLMIDPVRAGMG